MPLPVDLALHPSLWASPVPFGLGEEKPKHFREMARIAWENRDEAAFAWRILRDGVCDGCALGTTGLRDFTLSGTHLCAVRLNLLRLNTMGPLDPAELADVSALRAHSGAELRAMGRIPHPMLRRRGERGFTRIGWDQAMRLAAERVRATRPERLAFYLTSRGITNETYYVAGKVARLLGTNHVDNSARICHAPSTTTLKRSLGAAASTCSYTDWIGTDLLVFVGSDAANNQPVSTKYMYYARAEGTRIAMVNPYREPGMERYWIPSIADSAVFGTKLTTEFYQPRQGGDVAFFNGTLKALLAMDGSDRDWIERHTTGFEELERSLEAQSWTDLEAQSGTSRAEMERFARSYAAAKTAVFVWSMGITQHVFGVDNVQAIVNLALARGMVGREHCGLMPIRGHSGVQGGAEMGAVPWTLPGGVAVEGEGARHLFDLWGFEIPTFRGLSAVEQVDAAHRGELDVLWAIGGDYLSTLPEPVYCREALERVPLRVHQDIVLTHQMFVEPAEDVLLLPATTRYEMPGGGTETSTERRVYFSPEIPGRRIEGARPEWEVLAELAVRVKGEEDAAPVAFADTAAIRAEIARANPLYEGVQHLAAKGDAFQWGGPRLCEGGAFGTPDGRARFHPVSPPNLRLGPGRFHMSTRRGKQFNSMVQARKDPLNGMEREAVLMAASDVEALGLRDGDPVVVRSDVGEMRGRVAVADLAPGSLQLHWPEGNVLIRRGVVEPHCGIPDYSAVVSVQRA